MATTSEIQPAMTGTSEIQIPHVHSPCCIFRVPETLREINKSAYTPSAISIGPFHRHKSELQFMEAQKERYYNHYIEKSDVNSFDLRLKVAKWVKSIEQSYGDKIELRSVEDLVKMVLWDGLFVIEFFRRKCDPNLEDEKDKMLYQKLKESISTDLILLENQLPFFVLELLYKILFPDEQKSFLELSCQFFSNFNKQKITLGPWNNVLHFTDLIRTFHLPRLEQLPQITTHPENNETNQHISSYSAKELEENGVIFRASSSKCLLDIRFTVHDGVFEIPSLVINEEMECVFRNMMALEQFMYMDQSYICYYVYLLDTLINTSKDVELLVGKGIITNYIGDHEKVTTLFNNLNNKIILGDDLKNSYFYKIRQDSSNYYDKSWSASFKRSSPWQKNILSVAFVLLVLTFVQAICSIIQVVQGFKPK